MADKADKYLALVKKQMLARVQNITLRVERKAKQNCPVKTGTLKRSITHEIDKEHLEARVGSNVEYAPHLELGTSKMSARPYLRPALEAVQQELKGEL